MKILIKFPTRGRKNKFFNVLKKYHKLLDNINNVKFLITCDLDDSEMNNELTNEIISTFENTEIIFGNSKSKIDAVNRDLENYHDWDIVLLASDDMIPQVKGYDRIIVEKMNENFPDTDGVLWFNDGNQKRNLNTLSILGKKYYDRFKYIYFPEYKSTWCDNEFMDVANILGKQKYFDDVIIRHEHPDWGFGGRDLIHKGNLDNEPFDKTLYISRKKFNFFL